MSAYCSRPDMRTSFIVGYRPHFEFTQIGGRGGSPPGVLSYRGPTGGGLALLIRKVSQEI